ncbi:hypothetical protein P7K49_006087 [Saguinus oedipus]|uniref:Uncharacterized protein n=1 Tax=Saguinus oedipus TaxID=9490 RepID=A0ABQ9W257_SAGOE|nr:hypothetical protein P7K49_006087 [Saguinus oedipus]
MKAASLSNGTSCGRGGTGPESTRKLSLWASKTRPLAPRAQPRRGRAGLQRGEAHHDWRRSARAGAASGGPRPAPSPPPGAEGRASRRFSSQCCLLPAAAALPASPPTTLLPDRRPEGVAVPLLRSRGLGAVAVGSAQEAGKSPEALHASGLSFPFRADGWRIGGPARSATRKATPVPGPDRCPGGRAPGPRALSPGAPPRPELQAGEFERPGGQPELPRHAPPPRAGDLQLPSVPSLQLEGAWAPRRCCGGERRLSSPEDPARPRGSFGPT